MTLEEFEKGYEWVNDPHNSELVGVDELGNLYLVSGVSENIPDFVVLYIKAVNEKNKKMRLRHEMRKKAGLTVPVRTGENLKIY